MTTLDQSVSLNAAHEQPLIMFAGILIGTAALMICGVQPVVLGGLAEVGRLSEAGVGQAVMFEFVGIAIGSSFGPFVMNGRMRSKAMVASALLVLLNIAVYRQPTAPVFLAERGMAGIFEGLLLGATSLLLTHTRQPVRWSGIMMTVSQIPQVAAGYLMPSVIIPRFGIDACFLVLAACAGVSLLCAATIVDRVEAHSAAKHGRLRLTAPLVVCLLGVLLQNICMGSVWGYIEQLAHQRRFDPHIVGIAVGGALASMGVGSSLAAWVADRVSPIKMLVTSGIVQTICTVLLVSATSPAAFIAPLLVVSLFWTSVVPFTVGAYVALDTTRRVALLNAPINLGGQAIGPLLVSFFVAEGNVLNVYWISIVLFATATVAFMMVPVLARERERVTA